MRDKKTLLKVIGVAVLLNLVVIFAFFEFFTEVLHLRPFSENAPPAPPAADTTSAEPEATLKYLNEAHEPATPDDYLKQAQIDFAAGHYKSAMQRTQKAEAIIARKNSELYRTVLPQPTDEWQVDEKAEQAMIDKEKANAHSAIRYFNAPAVSRSYTSNGRTVKLFINPNLDPQMYRMMEMNAANVGIPSSSNGRIHEPLTIKGNQALYTEYDAMPIGNAAKSPVTSYLANKLFAGRKTRRLQVFVAGDLISFQSDNTPKEQIIEFANSFDYDKLKSLQ